MPAFEKDPPPELIRVHGGRVVRVLRVDDPDPRKRRGHTDAVILAWAPRLEGGWGVLVAWLSDRMESGHMTGRGRWAWCRLLTDRTVPVVPYVMDGDEWYGRPADSELGKGVLEAVESLPEHLRAAALRPAPPLPGPDTPAPRGTDR